MWCDGKLKAKMVTLFSPRAMLQSEKILEQTKLGRGIYFWFLGLKLAIEILKRGHTVSVPRLDSSENPKEKLSYEKIIARISLPRFANLYTWTSFAQIHEFLWIAKKVAVLQKSIMDCQIRAILAPSIGIRCKQLVVTVQYKTKPDPFTLRGQLGVLFEKRRARPYFLGRWRAPPSGWAHSSPGESLSFCWQKNKMRARLFYVKYWEDKLTFWILYIHCTLHFTQL